MRAPAVLILLILATGCSAMPRVEKIAVPVTAQCAPPPNETRPVLPIAQLTDDSKPDLVVRAYAASVSALQGYAMQLEKDLDGYRPKTKPSSRGATQ